MVTDQVTMTKPSVTYALINNKKMKETETETTVTLSLNITTRAKKKHLNIVTTSKIINELSISSQHTYQNVGENTQKENNQTAELIKLFTTFTKQLNK